MSNENSILRIYGPLERLSKVALGPMTVNKNEQLKTNFKDLGIFEDSTNLGFHRLVDRGDSEWWLARVFRFFGLQNCICSRVG